MRFRTVQVLFLCAALCMGGCRDDDDDNGNTPKSDGQTSKTDGGGTTEGATIYDIMQGNIAEGETVVLEDVIVTAVDTTGQYTGDIYVQEAAGGEYSGIKVYRPQRIDGGEVKDLKPGDHVKVEGPIKYFVPGEGFNDDNHPNKVHIIELDQGSQITRISEGTAPEPVKLTIDDLTTDPSAAKWEHVLVTVENVAVTSGVHPTHGDFKVTDGAAFMDVDDELFLLNPAIEDCISVTGISSYFFGYKVLPRSAADSTSGTGCPTATAVTITDLQDPQSANKPAVGTWVKVEGVISAVDGTPSGNGSYYDFWIQQEEGGPYSGIYIYYSWKETTPAARIPTLGDKVRLYGTYEEYKPGDEEETLSELKYPVWETLQPAATPIAPVVVDPADIATGGAMTEQYEGVLVKVENVEIAEYVTDKNDKKVAAKLAGSGLVVDAALFNFLDPDPPALGTTYTSITGPLHYSFGNFKILPRGADDLVAE